MKLLKRIIIALLSQAVRDKLDPNHCTYSDRCSTEDTVATLIHLVAKYLDSTKSYELKWKRGS